MWIVTVWQRISQDLTAKGFKKWCTLSATEETDGDMLWDGSKEDGNVRNER
jgi:hypothetical protein